MESLYTERRKELRKRARMFAISRLNEAAKILYQEGASKVIVFGSVIEEGRFAERSDVDMAVEGIPEQKRLRVEGMLVDVFGEIEFDIIFLEERDAVRPEILERIEKRGVVWKP